MRQDISETEVSYRSSGRATLEMKRFYSSDNMSECRFAVRSIPSKFHLRPNAKFFTIYLPSAVTIASKWDSKFAGKPSICFGLAVRSTSTW